MSLCCYDIFKCLSNPYINFKINLSRFFKDEKLEDAIENLAEFEIDNTPNDRNIKRKRILKYINNADWYGRKYQLKYLVIGRKNSYTKNKILELLKEKVCNGIIDETTPP